MKIKNIEKVTLIICLLAAFIFTINIEVKAADVVSSRISEIKKQYPQGSKFRGCVSVIEKTNSWDYNVDTMCMGCDGFVAYTTLKVFHSPFAYGSKQYKKIGTASTKSSSSMRKLFKKAKKGDVVYIYNSKGECHAMIFLSDSKTGIKVYEANFSTRDKVWYNHSWKYTNFKSWSHGGTKVSVYHSKNYTSVNKKTAARKLKVGTKFNYYGYRYKVTNNSIANAKVKIIGTASLTQNQRKRSKPKYIGVNFQRAKYKNYEYTQFGPYTFWQNKTYTTYKKIKYLNIKDEEFFKVVK